MAAQDQKITPPEAPKDSPKNHVSEEPVSRQIDNAHAAGAGAMGRNDEKLPTGADAADGPSPDDPAY